MRIPLGRARVLGTLALVCGAIFGTMSAGHAATLPTNLNGIRIMWGMGQTASAQTNANQLISHGGLVETQPAVYVVFWGTEWKNGFTVKADATHKYTASAIENYVDSFFNNVGGSRWAGVQTQYCQNVPAGTVDCRQYPYAQYVGNPTHQLKGVWVDPTAVPANIVTTGLAQNVSEDPVATEATRAAQHFGYNINATYFVLTPPGHTATAYGSVYCAYHTETTVPGAHGVRYAFVPFLPDAGCGQNAVNAKNDAFGHGFLDSYSIVAGHEYSEAVTDPDNLVYQDGWNDAATEENGDKCAWTDLRNATMGTMYFAVQPTWSNRANGGQGGCAHSL